MQPNAIVFYTKLERPLSKTRFEAYRNGGTESDAMCRYLWNTAICESLYPSFQILEVAFRNAAHIEIAKLHPDWLLTGGKFLQLQEQDAIKSAKESVNGRYENETEHLLVAEMKFGFWTSLLDSRYELIWHKIIKDVFPNMPKSTRTRGDASVVMNKVRKLRNAALHRHSIWHWKDLREQHETMRKIIHWICESSAKMAGSVDRFPIIYAGGHPAFSGVVQKLSN